MSGYKKTGLITLIILILLAFGVYKVNQLILKQLDRVNAVHQPAQRVTKQTEVKKAEPRVIEGLIIEGEQLPAPAKKISPARTKTGEKPAMVYEPSINEPILVQ